MRKHILKVSFIIFMLFTVTLAKAADKSPVVIYKTYQEFANKKGVTYADYLGYNIIAGAYLLNFEKSSGGKETFKTKELWGFTYKDALFRIAVEDRIPARLISFGEICYYENGFAHLSILKYNKSEGNAPVGVHILFSKDIESEIIGVPLGKTVKNYKPIEAMVAARADYESLFECMGRGTEMGLVRRCVEDFEKMFKKK